MADKDNTTNMTYNPFTLEGKTVLVTGASSGIGRATAIECSKLGARVVVTGRHKERLQETFDSLSGEGHVQVQADLLVADDVECLVASLDALDGVVLCAGRGKTIPVQFATREIFDEVFDVNFFSTVELIRLVYKRKLLKSGGAVVFIASIAGSHVFNAGNAVYGASKAALNSMMKFCAKEFAPRKIRVNSICPGMVETPLIDMPAFSAEKHEAQKQLYLLKRYGKPEEIAYSAVFLLSDAAMWITGHELVVDGGRTIG